MNLEQAATFKDEQRMGWTGVAEGWAKWTARIDEGATQLTRLMMRRAHLAPGMCVLDIASGAGEPGLTAARIVAPHGRVTLTDLSPAMLDAARRRAAALGITNACFVEADAEVLDLPDTQRPFDAALCRWGLMFVGDVARAVRAVRARLGAGGRFVAAVWGPPPEVPLIALAATTLHDALGLEPPPPGTPGVFALADPAPLTGALGAAGFVALDTEDVDVPMRFASTDEYLDFLREVAPPVTALLSHAPPEQHAELWQRVADAAAPRVAADGQLTFHNRAIVISASLPQ